MLQWQQVALKLTTENRQLQGLLKVVPDRAVSYVSARVIANSGGAYVRTVMINSDGQMIVLFDEAGYRTLSISLVLDRDLLRRSA